MFGFLLVLAAAPQVAEPSFSVYYSDTFSEWYSQILIEEPSFESGTPVIPAETIRSRLGTSKAEIVQTDAVQVPYDQSLAFITVTTELGAPIHIRTSRFRSVTLSWVGESLLVVTRDVGHVAGIEEIFDLDQRRWLLQRSLFYEKR